MGKEIVGGSGGEVYLRNDELHIGLDLTAKR